MPPTAPTIKALDLSIGKTGQAKLYRTDESIVFAVEGNIVNFDNPAKRCGWTLQMTNLDGGAPVAIGTGNQFFPNNFSKVLSSFKPGNYKLNVVSTTADDGLAPVGCAGHATEYVKLEPAIAMIKDVRLKEFGYHFNMASDTGHGSPGGESLGGHCENCDSIFSPAHNIAGLRITPVFADGKACQFMVIQEVNGTPVSNYPVKYTPGAVFAGDKEPWLNIYHNSKISVKVTIIGMPIPGLSACDGSVTKTIEVSDDDTLPAVTK